MNLRLNREVWRPTPELPTNPFDSLSRYTIHEEDGEQEVEQLQKSLYDFALEHVDGLLKAASREKLASILRQELHPLLVGSVLTAFADHGYKLEGESRAEFKRHLNGLHKELWESYGLPWKNRKGRVDLYEVTVPNEHGSTDPDAELNEWVPKLFAHLRTIEELTESNAPQTLSKEFGITAFHRYAPEVLASQYEHRNNTDINYGVLVSSFADENGGFAEFDRETFEIQEELMGASAGHLRIIEVRNGLDAMRKSLKTHERYGKNPWKFVFIAGHGWEELEAISFAIVPTDHPTAHYPGGLRKEHFQDVVFVECLNGLLQKRRSFFYPVMLVSQEI